MITIDKRQDGTTLYLEVGGSIDASSCRALREALGDSFMGIRTIILDFRSLTFLSSAGLRLLLDVQNRADAAQANLVIRNANDDVWDIFEMTGFTEIMNIES